jgi:hypothetical protein
MEVTAFAGRRLGCRTEKKNANLHGLAFCLTLILVARGGIEPPTQGFSKQGSDEVASAIFAASAK